MLISWLKQNGAVVLLLGGILAYAGFVGTTGKCPSCLFLPKDETAATAAGPASHSPNAGARSAAPVLNLTLVDSKSLPSLAGKVVLVDFWATWCPPCRQMIPGLIELQKTYGERGFTVVGLSTDQGEAGTVLKFMERVGINYPVALADGQLAQAFGGIEYLPTSFLIDRAGRIVSRHVGYMSKSELEAQLKPLLDEPNPTAGQLSAAVVPDLPR